MSASWGNALRLTIFGQSHGASIGMVLDGLPPGLPVDLEYIAREMRRRAPGRDETATARREEDAVEIESGIYEGYTCGAPLCARIRNQDAHSEEYAQTLARPGHADYVAQVKYRGFQDPRGGGHFSGRLTAPLVLAGAMARQLLALRGVEVAAHILRVGTAWDTAMDPAGVDAQTLRTLRMRDYPTFSREAEQAQRTVIAQARAADDAVGGVIACAAVGVPAGWGEPFFRPVESVMAGLLYAIPAVKAVAFGEGFGFADLPASEANDAWLETPEGPRTRTNHNGGINGGITNGMPLLAQVAVKPTPSIARLQQTIDWRTGRTAEICGKGRYDPCILPRAVPAVEAAMLLALADLALEGGAFACGI